MASPFASVYLLHEKPDLMEQTVALLNEEWPRGGDRTTTLTKSNAKFPLNIVGVSSDGVVVAHARLSIVDDEAAQGLLLESVVVSKALRGKGIGRAIMDEAERYAVKRGYSTLYLSTHDQQGFYARLGFEECEPVTSLGDNSSRISKAQLANLLSAFGGKGASQTKDKTWMKKGAVLS